MTWPILLTRALLIPVGALSGALVGAATGADAALPDPSLSAGSSPGYVLFAAALGAVPGGVLGCLIGGLCTALLFFGELVPGVRSRRPRQAAVVAWGVGVWAIATLGVLGVMLLVSGAVPITYQAPPAEAAAAQWGQPLALSAVAAVLLAVGIAAERIVVLRFGARERWIPGPLMP
ncbi:hypothetical protein ACFJGV_07995 [Cnuibacter sp. UC19_7]|uniref:hypothetical protein n=1 Tax=Cnuibacter sp. UC19_7 TaxID=3350166 RepID=UPI00366EAA0E